MSLPLPLPLPLRIQCPLSLTLFARIASLIATLIGTLVLLGWILDIAPFKSFLPGELSMKVNTATCFLLAGLSLWLLPWAQTNLPVRRIAQVCASIVALLGLLTLLQYLSGQNFGIDELVFKDNTAAIRTVHPGRMAPNTSLNHLLIGIVLLLLHTPSRRAHQVAQILSIPPFLIALLALIGYGYGTQSLYGLAAYTPMALHTAVAFLVLTIGLLLAYPDRGIMTIMTADQAGGLLARRLTPAIIALPLLLGWLLLIGGRAGLYDEHLQFSLLVVLSFLTFATLVLFTAYHLNRVDAQRQQDEHQFRHHLHERLLAEQTAVQLAEQRLAELQDALTLRDQLNTTVRELSSPVLPVLAGILVMPLIGAIDSERAQLITSTLLESIAQHRAHMIIIDVTGVPVVDTQVARVLLSAADAARLLGTETMLVGIRPELARTITMLGLDLSHLVMRVDLRSGIQSALQQYTIPLS